MSRELLLDIIVHAPGLLERADQITWLSSIAGDIINRIAVIRRSLLTAVLYNVLQIATL